ncbi:hypothetical protein TNCV_3861961 [Trichonephila clavipes]|nr:hypothetical protein TNCV_3861961 [Trichonephila clavipes]
MDGYYILHYSALHGINIVNRYWETRCLMRKLLFYVEGYGSPVVSVSGHVRRVMSSNPVPLKTCHVGERCTLRAETFSRWCGVVVRRECASSGVVHVT